MIRYIHWSHHRCLSHLYFPGRQAKQAQQIPNPHARNSKLPHANPRFPFRGRSIHPIARNKGVRAAASSVVPVQGSKQVQDPLGELIAPPILCFFAGFSTLILENPINFVGSSDACGSAEMNPSNSGS